MASVNVFIDGTWLFNACRYERSLSNATEKPNENFSLDFHKLNSTLVRYVKSKIDITTNVQLGDIYLSTSIFSLPDDIDSWPTYHEDVTIKDIERVRKSVITRREFVNKAVLAGYKEDGVFMPPIKPYIIKKLAEDRYQEKQVDATIVALLVKYAITRSLDYHIVISGDADMLPAIRIAYPEYTNNVIIATTHPDAINKEQRQSSFSLLNFNCNTLAL